MLRESLPELLLDLALEYGDVMRFRVFPSVYSTTNPEFVREILTLAYPKYTKSTIEYRVIARTLGNGLVTNDGEDWARQRRLMQPVFSSRTINSFDTSINKLTAQIAKEWDAKASSDTVWLDRDMSRITF